MPCSYQLLQFNFFYFSALSPTKLSCATAVYITSYLSISSPRSALWQASFILKWFSCLFRFVVVFLKEREQGRDSISPTSLSLQTSDSRAMWSHLDPSLLFGLPRCMVFKTAHFSKVWHPFINSTTPFLQQSYRAQASLPSLSSLHENPWGPATFSYHCPKSKSIIHAFLFLFSSDTSV